MAVPVSRVRGRHALHGDETDTRPGGQLALQPHHGVGLMLGEDLQTTGRQWTDASREPSAAYDGYRLAERVDADATGEEQVDSLRRAGGEDAGVLEKERSLLREEQRKAGEVGALLIDLDLREVGVVREVESETGRHAILDLAADLPAPPGLGIDRVVALQAGEHVRRHRPHPARRHGDARQR